MEKPSMSVKLALAQRLGANADAREKKADSGAEKADMAAEKADTGAVLEKEADKAGTSGQEGDAEETDNKAYGHGFSLGFAKRGRGSSALVLG